MVEILHNALKEILESPEWKEFMETNGFGMAYLPPEEFAKFLENDYKAVGELLKAAGYTS
ncbi:hypothetical protein OCC_14165 [Thermococcus litoralis DSM 5473]|uniref:Tripartite tricarboxylate transporter substrate binding protein n=1 Tax=Thermococcus litoralis (strain ATCC 51850 / DSM 5473 / JCM 8560 / NS-C) TaxID=523849 RepID=S5ZTT8_THELN|nr:hypothetical protein OCC_14165 [Thermococcus litoralis DSM 5473]